MVTTPSFAPALAFRLSAALESYQGHVDALMNPFRDRERYEAVRRRFQEIRTLKGGIPQLSVAMVDVFIVHTELMESLWRAGRRPGGEEAGRIGQLRERHAAAVARMREQCLRIFSRSAA